MSEDIVVGSLWLVDLWGSLTTATCRVERYDHEAARWHVRNMKSMRSHAVHASQLLEPLSEDPAPDDGVTP